MQKPTGVATHNSSTPIKQPGITRYFHRLSHDEKSFTSKDFIYRPIGDAVVRSSQVIDFNHIIDLQFQLLRSVQIY